MSASEINIIINEFHGHIFKLLKVCQRFEPSNIDLEWLRKQLGLARDIDPLLIINKCAPKIWGFREQIIAEDDAFFLNNQYDHHIKIDQNRSFIIELVNLIKKRIAGMSVVEKRAIWTMIKGLLISVTKYLKATENF